MHIFITSNRAQILGSPTPHKLHWFGIIIPLIISVGIVEITLGYRPKPLTIYAIKNSSSKEINSHTRQGVLPSSVMCLHPRERIKPFFIMRMQNPYKEVFFFKPKTHTFPLVHPISPSHSETLEEIP